MNNCYDLIFIIKVGSGVTDWTKGHGNALLMERSVLGTSGTMVDLNCPTPRSVSEDIVHIIG